MMRGDFLTTYAYLRRDYPVSTEEQIEKLNSFSYDVLFMEDSDLKSYLALNKMRKKIKKSDSIIICDLRVFAGSNKFYKELFGELQSKKIRLICINEAIDTENSLKFYSDAISVIGGIEDHRNYLSKIKLNQSRKDGKLGGRPRIAESTIQKIKFLRDEYNLSYREIAILSDVSLATVYKYGKK